MNSALLGQRQDSPVDLPGPRLAGKKDILKICEKNILEIETCIPTYTEEQYKIIGDE